MVDCSLRSKSTNRLPIPEYSVTLTTKTILFYDLVWQYLGIDTHAEGQISIPGYLSSMVGMRLVL